MAPWTRIRGVLIHYVGGEPLDVDPSGLQTACVASVGKREGFVRISVVLLRFLNELKTTSAERVNIMKFVQHAVISPGRKATNEQR